MQDANTRQQTLQTNTASTNSIRVFRIPSHPCSYKTDRQASTMFVEPGLIIDRHLHSRLSEMGFRRNGIHLYRPDCDNCRACIPCRIPVAGFKFSRSQRRVLNRNKDLRIVPTRELTQKAAFALFRRYIASRHADGGMYPASEEQFESFIQAGTAYTRYHLCYDGEKLIAVSVVDELEQGMSAVYTFFDPDESRRSLGKFAILAHIRQCQESGLPYLYLGYWIKDCAKMQYKGEYRPLEILSDGRWVSVK